MCLGGSSVGSGALYGRPYAQHGYGGSYAEPTDSVPDHRGQGRRGDEGNHPFEPIAPENDQDSDQRWRKSNGYVVALRNLVAHACWIVSVINPAPPASTP